MLDITRDQALEIINSDCCLVVDNRTSDEVYIHDDGEGDALWFESDILIEPEDFARCTWKLQDEYIHAYVGKKKIWTGWVWLAPVKSDDILNRVNENKCSNK